MAQHGKSIHSWARFFCIETFPSHLHPSGSQQLQLQGRSGGMACTWPTVQRCALACRRSRSTSAPMVATAVTSATSQGASPSRQTAATAAAAGAAEAAAPDQQEPEPQQRPQQQAQQPRTRPTQGQLVERCLVRGPPTIDIGANLVDRSFDKVCEQSACSARLSLCSFAHLPSVHLRPALSPCMPYRIAQLCWSVLGWQGWRR
jgi:hypothetical protein